MEIHGNFIDTFNSGNYNNGKILWNKVKLGRFESASVYYDEMRISFEILYGYGGNNLSYKGVARGIGESEIVLYDNFPSFNGPKDDELSKCIEKAKPLFNLWFDEMETCKCLYTPGITTISVGDDFFRVIYKYDQQGNLEDTDVSIMSYHNPWFAMLSNVGDKSIGEIVDDNSEELLSKIPIDMGYLVPELRAVAIQYLSEKEGLNLVLK